MNKVTKEKAEQILNRFSLRKTDLRIHLILLFLKKKKNLYRKLKSSKNLKKKLGL